MSKSQDTSFLKYKKADVDVHLLFSIINICSNEISLFEQKLEYSCD
jgi:hypothetical protein